ncbi:hypothetical protein [Modestobacter altitudinis]|uniref:hypothetical protein n=1 Tax=Modestobacter altitudinis TaxID=2213158 RepID=UPI00110CF6EE|nr:hypothetical protein [Modestobacter altitudinis]
MTDHSAAGGNAPPRTNPLWAETDRLRNEGPIEVFRVLAKATERGIAIDWRDVTDLAAAAGKRGFGRPRYLLDFLAALAQRLAPVSIIDPYVTSPLPLAALANGGAARVAGIVPHDDTFEAGKLILPGADWQLGDPLAALSGEALDRYELVWLGPPIGLRLPTHGPAVVTPAAVNDVAGAMLWQARQLVAPHGRLIYQTADNWFGDQGMALRRALADAGLYLTAVVSVEAGFAPASGIPSSLAVFEGEATADLFVARLDARTPVARLIDQLLARRPDREQSSLGALTSFDYRGWAPYLLNRELADAFAADELQSVGELGIVRNLNLRPDQPYEAPPNALFVPTLGAGEVWTTPPEVTGQRPYRLIEVELDPAKARSEYVASLLSSPVGKRLREAVATGSTIPNLKAAALAGIRIPLPPVAAQDEVIRAAAHLASMEATIGRLRGDLWRHPEAATRVVERLERAAKADPVKRWLESLPYPLASVLQRYVAQRDTEARVQSLINFFEATAQFGCAVLLSVFQADLGLFTEVQPDLIKAAPPGRQLLDRADFALWLGLGPTLARHVRRLAGDTAQRDALERATGPAGELVRRLADKTLWTRLHQARVVRNQRSHGGVTSAAQLDSWLSSLETLLSEVEQALGTAFEDVDLVLAAEGRFKHGLHTYSRAQRLRGANASFEEFEVRTRQPMESEQLSFVAREAPISSVLKLVPLVRIGATTSKTKNAVYFFESRQAGAVSYVSYHFEDEPRIQVQDADLENLAQQFTSADGPARPR